MKRTILKLTICVLFALSISHSFGQHLPFQGKLHENGQPVNGVRIFQFSINNGVINWSETQSVQLNNGLYAVVLGSVSALPQTLFAQQVALDMIIQVNGSLLDTVQLYPPIESDPTVPSNVKDGVSWSEVANKPSNLLDDVDASNELQQLSVSGTDLSISDGNTVSLPQSALPAEFQMNPADTTELTIITQDSTNNTNVAGSMWQAFTSSYNKPLKEISLKVANSLATDITLNILKVQGATFTPIYTDTFPSTVISPAYGEQTIELPNPIQLQASTVYVFEVVGISSDLIFGYSTSNPYPGGESDLGASSDYYFKLVVYDYQPYSVQLNGNFSTASNGVNQYMVPSGIITMWSGALTSIPDGWVLCDGNNNTPDLRNRFVVGAGGTYSVEDIGGEDTHTLTQAELPAHKHSFSGTTSTNTHSHHIGTMWTEVCPANCYGQVVAGNGGTGKTTNNDSHNHSFSGNTNNTGSNAAHENRPPYFALAYIMKL